MAPSINSSLIWPSINMSFSSSLGLPPSNGYTILLVVVDRFSKVVHISALQSNFTAYKVVELFVSIVCKHHGLSRSTVSDRDPIFISHFWSDLFKFSGTLLRMSSSYHSQTDDQTEVMNRTIEQYLRAFVHHKPSFWFKFLPWVEYHYNTSIHSGSGLSPFEVMFGKQPPSIPHYIEGSSSNDGCNIVLSSLRMKKNVDAKRRDLNLEVGSWVYVKLQPYRQISISGNKYHKLSKRYYGPFKVLEKIGHVAYRLELPSHSNIHDVFHCSMLNPHEGPTPSLIDQIPLDVVDNNLLISPLAILDFKTVTIEDSPTCYALVQWKGLSSDDTSWEKWDELKSLFDLEDKVIVEGDNIVT
ncbi:hypothetical protein V8G54_003187 [Vigna mungo]|uniref:Integrase catalytic domain-containing protein n=1 Tax=Vigna mungo TaxID=3915 RepID=A0AAQ3PAI8_VIGMU